MWSGFMNKSARPANVFLFRDRTGRAYYAVAVREGDQWTQVGPGRKGKRASDTLRFFIVAPSDQTGQQNAHHIARRRYGYSRLAPYPLDTYTQKSYNDSN